MPLPLEVIGESVALGNTKAYGDQGAYQLYTMNSDNRFHTNALFGVSTRHFDSMSQLAVATTAAAVSGIQKLTLPEAAGLRQLDPASSQVATKGAQTTPPPTAG